MIIQGGKCLGVWVHSLQILMEVTKLMLAHIGHAITTTTGIIMVSWGGGGGGGGVGQPLKIMHGNAFSPLTEKSQ